MGPSSSPFVIFHSVAIIQQPIITSFNILILLKMCNVAIKIITKNQLLKMNWSYDINILIKSWKILELV